MNLKIEIIIIIHITPHNLKIVTSYKILEYQNKYLQIIKYSQNTIPAKIDQTTQ